MQGDPAFEQLIMTLNSFIGNEAGPMLDHKYNDYD